MTVWPGEAGVSRVLSGIWVALTKFCAMAVPVPPLVLGEEAERATDDMDDDGVAGEIVVVEGEGGIAYGASDGRMAATCLAEV